MNKKSSTEERKLAKAEGKGLEKCCADICDVLVIPYIHITTSVTRRVGEKWCNFPIPGMKGWPDFFLFLDGGQTICVECKWGKGQLTKEQREKREILTELGFPYYIINTAEDFLALAKKLLEMNSEEGE
jgi:hypothetical protein